MNYIKLFEEFTEETLSKNNYEYDNYFKNSKSRSNKVAWSHPRSQIKNFRLVSKLINENDSVLDYGCGIGDFIRYLDKNKNISDYLGVDINSNFINMAKKDYPDNNFQLIKNVNEIKGKWDSVCTINNQRKTKKPKRDNKNLIYKTMKTTTININVITITNCVNNTTSGKQLCIV